MRGILIHSGLWRTLGCIQRWRLARLALAAALVCAGACFLGCFLGLVTPVAVWAQAAQSTAVVDGLVNDAAGGAVAGATVELRVGTYRRVDKTDASGAFLFE